MHNIGVIYAIAIGLHPMKNRSVLLATLFGLSSALLSLTTLTPPPAAQAYLARQEIRVERLKAEPYAAFISRSELIARAAIQRTFDRDLLASVLVVHIIGLHQGAEAPVMSVEVSRSQWQQRPDSRRWATYYRMSQILLGFGSSPLPVLQPDATTANPLSVQPPTLPIVPLPSPTPTPTASPTSTASPTPKSSPTSSPTPRPTVSPTASPTASPTPKSSPTPAKKVT